MKDKLLAFPQIDSMVFKTSELELGMQHLAGFLTKGRGELKVVAVVIPRAVLVGGSGVVAVCLPALDPERERSASATTQDSEGYSERKPHLMA